MHLRRLERIVTPQQLKLPSLAFVVEFRRQFEKSALTSDRHDFLADLFITMINLDCHHQISGMLQRIGVFPQELFDIEEIIAGLRRQLSAAEPIGDNGNAEDAARTRLNELEAAIASLDREIEGGPYLDDLRESLTAVEARARAEVARRRSHVESRAEAVAALDTARFERHLEKSDVPLVVDFWAAWCGPCRAMAPEFERAAAMLEPEARLVKVNVDEEPALAQQFQTRSIPTILIALHGREVARVAGARSAAQLVEWVRRELSRLDVHSS